VGYPYVLTALWYLVWPGVDTNDSLAPLRAVLGKGAPARRRKGTRPRPGTLTRLGPPAAAGRWSLVTALGVGGAVPGPSETERAHALALQLLERYGVVTREAVRAEGVPGGYAAVYPVLRALEETGRVRRGYFVAGLGAAQFALPGAVDRLRAHREPEVEEPGGGGDDPGALVLAATDPAQPYGAALAWPEAATGAPRPSRSAGALVVLTAGAPTAYLDRSGRNVVTFGPPGAWVEPVARMVKDGRLRQLELVEIDGTPVRDTPAAEPLRSAGFKDAYRGLVLRG
jgi:ATP-dependent Lhr-like helicase